MTLRKPLAASLLALALACQKHVPAIDAPLPAAPAANASEPPSSGRGLFAPALSYPPGPWRSASPEEVERLVLWSAHLLVRYDGVKDAEDVAFKMADFHSVLPAPTRLREEALALARALARRAREAPERFEELVREHSEDVVSREHGGSLGGVPASQLTPWPEVLDALTALAPGEVSDVVETWYGFHVFQRRPAPAPDTVTGRRIVIGHDRAHFLSTLLAEHQPARPRQEALELAHELYERARTSPSDFPELVERYSEHPDRVIGGDFGTWGTRELTPFPSEVEVMGQLRVGQVARPLDSLFGIEIIQRVANPERAIYAFEGVALHFDPAAPSADPKSRASVRADALRLGEELRREPSRLAALSQRYLQYRGQWLDGRGLPELTVALREVAVGEMLRAPARSGARFIVGRRIEPRAEAPLAASSALPLLRDPPR